MVKLSNWITQKSSRKITFAALIIFIAFTTTALPAQSKKAERYSSEVGSVDLSLWYTSAEVYEMAEAYGESGRQAYIEVRLTFDVIWPIIYMVFLSTLISFSFKKIFELDHKIYLLNLIPVFGLIFDYFENFSASWIMYKFPTRLTFLSNLAPVFTFVKWILVFLGFIILLYGLAAWIRIAIQKNN